LTVNRESQEAAETVATQRIWLTTEDVAERFRTSPGTVRYWRHIGYGPKGVRIGRRTLYDATGVDAWEAEQLAKAKA
jgi:hypothetical protein